MFVWKRPGSAELWISKRAQMVSWAFVAVNMHWARILWWKLLGNPLEFGNLVFCWAHQGMVPSCAIYISIPIYLPSILAASLARFWEIALPKWRRPARHHGFPVRTGHWCWLNPPGQSISGASCKSGDFGPPISKKQVDLQMDWKNNDRRLFSCIVQL